MQSERSQMVTLMGYAQERGPAGTLATLWYYRTVNVRQVSALFNTNFLGLNPIISTLLP